MNTPDAIVKIGKLNSKRYDCVNCSTTYKVQIKEAREKHIEKKILHMIKLLLMQKTSQFCGGEKSTNEIKREREKK